jgi:hypothetical protein
MKPMFFIAFLALGPALADQTRPTPIPASASVEIATGGQVCETDGALLRASAWLPPQDRWSLLCHDRS